jgi:O-methyltransferase
MRSSLISRALRRVRPSAPQAEDSPAHVPPMIATLTEREREIAEITLQHSITSHERIVAVLDAVRYCVQREIPGAFAECGVWRGGSVMAMIYALQDLGRDDRDIYLFDTFEGMTEPTDLDTSPVDRSAQEWWAEAEQSGDRAFPHFFDREVFNEDVVRENVLGTGYPAERVHFVRGRVEDTLPQHAPETLALLRLDTDWYESTKHELVHLYPRLVDGGVLIIDDYGHWEGCRRAVDEYFSSEADPILLGRIDYTGRIAVKR